MDRLVLTWRSPCGQVGIDLKFILWTGLYCLGIYTVDRMALILNLPF